MRDELVFWFSQPPKVERGAYNEITYLWDNKVYYICLGEWGEERKKLNWDDDNYGNAVVVNLNKQENVNDQIETFFAEHPDAIHIIPGFTSEISQKVSAIAFRRKSRLCVLTERPNAFGNILVRMIRKVYVSVKYRKLWKIFDPYLDILLPLGQTSVNEYATFGWDRKKMFPFMYCPEAEPLTSEPADFTAKPVQMLFVGRFMYSTKGLDVLCKALDGLKGNWKIDFVGGYGKDHGTMMKWIDNNPNANYLGIWESNKVISKINAYDVVVVPSKYEGWNMIVYEAMMAGIGVITTDQATSDELVTASGAGKVVKSYSVKQMKTVLQEIVDSPKVLNNWREKAKAYQGRIVPERVARYLVDILDWKFYGKIDRPRCPWTD